MGNYEYFTLGRRNLYDKNHWEQLPSSLFRITKPTVLCFGGNCTINPKDANAMCKIAQGLVGIKMPKILNEYATCYDVDFIGIGYGRDKRDSDSTGSLTNHEINSLTDTLFMPLCVSENGEILSQEQIIKNFNQITFFSHCFGSKEVSILIGNTYKKMLRQGIDADIIDKALDQMFAVSYAPYVKCDCPNLQVVSVKDSTLKTGTKDAIISKQFLERMLSTKDTSKGTVAYKEDNYTINVITSGLLKSQSDEHFMYYLSRDENWNFMKQNQSEFGDEVSQVMGYALASSVANSLQNQNSDTFIPKPSVDELLEDVQSILGETQNSDFEYTIDYIKNGKLNNDNSKESSNDTPQSVIRISNEVISENGPEFQQ